MMLAYRLVAHGIGARTVAELNETMDVEEFLTWAAFFSLEPTIEQRSDVHVAMLLAQTYNMYRGKGKPVKKPYEFVPQWYRSPAPPMTPEQLKWAAQSQFLALGGAFD